MNYLEPEFYRSFVQQELNNTIVPAISQARGKVLAAVHTGSTVKTPSTHKVWEISFFDMQRNQPHLWGWLGPNDVDAVIIYEGAAPVDALRRHYDSIRQDTMGSLEDRLPQERYNPVLDPAFYSQDFVENLIAQLSSSKENIHQVGIVLNNSKYTQQQALNRTLIRFVEFVYDRTMGLGAAEVNTESLSGLVTSPASYLGYLIGQDYAEGIAGRLSQAFWTAEINAMKGEREGKKQYVELALARAREEAGDLPYGKTFLRLDPYSRDSIMAYLHLQRGSEIRDAYGDLCQMFLPRSHELSDIGLLHLEAGMRNVDINTIIGEIGGVPIRHKTPEEVKELIRASKVFHTLEEFVCEIEK